MKRAALAALAVALAPSLGAAQGVALVPERDLPAWLTQWSVLAPRADLPRRLPGVSTSAVPATLFGRTPIGLFWTAGNPAGLARGVDSSRTDFIAAMARTRGDFRRPLDPGGSDLTQIAASSWRQIDPKLTVLGRVVLDQERFDPGTRADETEPYPTSPFVTTDSGTTPSRRTRARLEGVAGWALGPWSLGADLGYEARDHQTIEAGFVRRSRQAMPGLAIGAARQVGGIRFGLAGRYRHRAETVLLAERAAEGQVVALEGYRDVRPLSVQQSYYRLIEEDVPSMTLGAEGTLGRGRWVLFGEVAGLRERRTRQEQDNPAYDRWNADSWTAGWAYQRPLGRRWILTADGRYTQLTGHGDLALDSAATVFTANERVAAARIELRLLPDAHGWTALMALTGRYERRVRNDSIALVGSRFTISAPGVAVEIGRAVGRRVTLIGTVAVTGSVATSAIPAPLSRGAVYRQLIAPELDLLARNATPIAFGGVVRWRAPSGTALWLSGRVERVTPRGTSPSGFGPGGNRSAGEVMFGVELR